MRALRTTLAAAWLAGFAPAIASAQNTPDVMLKNFRPTQKGVEYDNPTDPAAVAACKVESVVSPQNKEKKIGYALRDGQGQLLRRFIDSDGKPGLDQWSYYQNGFEVYRDSDLNADRSADECRWMNSGGTRIAEIKGGKIVSWKRISAEEASKVLVQALIEADLALVETLLATPEELKAAGLPAEVVQKAAKAAAGRQAQIADLRKGLVGWSKDTSWTLFDGKLPHVIPADPATGLAADLMLYENALILAGPPNGQGDASKMAYLQAPEIVKVGETWKFADLPTAIDPQKPGVSVAARDTIRSTLFGQAGDRPQGDEVIPEIADLRAFDGKGGPDPGNGKAVLQYHFDRIQLLKKVVAKLPADGDQPLIYHKQIVDGLASLLQTGNYPAAAKPLDSYIEKGGKLASYAALHKLQAENTIESNEPGANPAKVQAAYLKKLEGFLKDYPQAEERPDARFQLATLNEFDNEEKEARAQYAKLVEESPASEFGKKAAGAIRRLDLVGKPLELTGKGVNGEAVDASKFQGKPLLVLFWTSTADAGRRELPELAKVQAKHKDQGLEVLGVCLDTDKAAVLAYLKDNSLAWPQILEPKGMDGEIANQYGIISLPTMFLVDAKGKVINRNIRSAAELDKLLDKSAAGDGPVGAALNDKTSR